MTVTEYAEQAGEIFVLSDSFVRIKELIDDESSTIDDISDVIIIDPAMTATILKLANSSFFNYPGKIDTISKAVLVLGITEVYSLVIAYFTAKAFKAVNMDKSYLDDFWYDSVDAALLIKFLGCSLNIPNGERLFILGLLHNLGELVVNQISPDKIIECSSGTASNLSCDKQKEVLGFTYGECGAELLKLWQLPYNIVAPIRNQNEDNFDLINTETQLLYISKQIMAHQKILQSNDDQGETINTLHLSSLGINDAMLHMASEYCNLERLSILSVLNPSSVSIY
jgi:HD-like signal output (HDOD) protein